MNNILKPIFIVTMFIESLELVLTSLAKGIGECTNQPAPQTMELDMLNNTIKINWLRDRLLLNYYGLALMRF